MHFIVVGFLVIFKICVNEFGLTWASVSYLDAIFVTLGNCVTSKSKVHNVLSNLDESIIEFNVVPMLWDNVNRRRYSSCFWWKKLDY